MKVKLRKEWGERDRGMKGEAWLLGEKIFDFMMSLELYKGCITAANVRLIIATVSLNTYQPQSVQGKIYWNVNWINFFKISLFYWLVII